MTREHWFDKCAMLSAGRWYGKWFHKSSLKAPSRPHRLLSTATMLLPRARFQTRYLVSVSCDVKGNTLIDPCWNGTYTVRGHHQSISRAPCGNVACIYTNLIFKKSTGKYIIQSVCTLFWISIMKSEWTYFCNETAYFFPILKHCATSKDSWGSVLAAEERLVDSQMTPYSLYTALLVTKAEREYGANWDVETEERETAVPELTPKNDNEGRRRATRLSFKGKSPFPVEKNSGHMRGLTALTITCVK